MVAYSKKTTPVAALEGDLHSCSFGRVPDCIPHYILHRAAQQLFESLSCAGVRSLNDHAAVSCTRFKIAVVRDLLHQVREVEPRRGSTIYSAVDSSKRQQLANQRIQPPRFQADPFEVLPGFFR